MPKRRQRQLNLFTLAALLLLQKTAAERTYFATPKDAVAELLENPSRTSLPQVGPKGGLVFIQEGIPMSDWMAGQISPNTLMVVGAGSSTVTLCAATGETATLLYDKFPEKTPVTARPKQFQSTAPFSAKQFEKGCTGAHKDAKDKHTSEVRRMHGL